MMREALWPLDIRVSPVLGFVEIPINGHARYTSVEIQQLRRRGRTGLAAIIHRRDKTVDIYFDAILELDGAWRRTDPAVVHLPDGILQATRFEDRGFAIGNDSINCDVAFRDLDAELIHVIVRQDPGKGQRLRMFVPMPVAAGGSVLRLLLLDQFCMIRRRGTTVAVQIGGIRCSPTFFSVPLGFTRRYSARFAQPILLAGLNPVGSHQPMQLPYTILNSDGDLLAARAGGAHDWFEFQFKPGLRSPSAIPVGMTRAGHLTVMSSLGSVSRGAWSLVRLSDNVLELTLDDIRQDWFPSPVRQPTLWLLAVLRWLKRRRQRLTCRSRLVDENGVTTLHSIWSSSTVRQEARLPVPHPSRTL